ncbi:MULTISPECIES: hypothetical protein [unclassified Streptomyces]|uniref:hypothetical protein n=1 Tax=unclassified Streptomyces TaxID=2593676 RepID=UPI000938F434|nr:hypothetical protein [Streptomyces sp. TSRI0281]OKI35018.1 hypothetical protein A6A29_16480 [Streptomyces sp. TSRI0281]
MSVTAEITKFTAYGPDRFAEHVPFARRGYLFTVPGSVPEDTPAHTNLPDWEMAVYRTRGEWEVRDVNGDRRVWGTGPSRRVAVGLALLEIARQRKIQAAEIGRRRVNVLGLEEVPPYEIEVTSEVTLVVTRERVGHYVRLAASEDGRPARYVTRDPHTRALYEVEAGNHVNLQTLRAGLLHIRCTCNPVVDGRYETESDALAAVRELLNTWTVCGGSLDAPSPDDQQPDDEDQADAEPAPAAPEPAEAASEHEPARDRSRDRVYDVFENASYQAQRARDMVQTAGLAVIAQLVRDDLPTAVGITIRPSDLALIAVTSKDSTLWTEGGPELQYTTRLNANAFLADTLAFGRDMDVLTDTGWLELGSDLFSVKFPPAL